MKIKVATRHKTRKNELWKGENIEATEFAFIQQIHWYHQYLSEKTIGEILYYLHVHVHVYYTNVWNVMQYFEFI